MNNANKFLSAYIVFVFGLGGKEYKEFNRGGKMNRVCISELIGEKINDRSK